MLKKISLALAAVVAVILAIAALQNPKYVISREIKINAPAEKVFPYLNNAKLGERWGPWTEVDPAAKMVHSGPEEGVGARTSWDSTGQLGTGSATIVESVPLKLVGIKLEYTKPMEMHQYSEYIVQQNAQGGAETTVTWKVTGENNYTGRVMCLFMNMDKMVGGMFEKGLLNLKTLVEKSN